ncbi:MAG: hypothetical protein ACXAEN_20195 [Candidatus Thorarchaeota archaeon]|jgi:hypothetical protein
MNLTDTVIVTSRYLVFSSRDPGGALDDVTVDLFELPQGTEPLVAVFVISISVVILVVVLEVQKRRRRS